jgi:hypothetical protein
MQFLFGIIVGIIVSSIGFSGVARFLDQGVHIVQNASRTAAHDLDHPSDEK